MTFCRRRLRPWKPFHVITETAQSMMSTPDLGGWGSEALPWVLAKGTALSTYKHHLINPS